MAEPNRGLVFTARTYERVMAGSFALFYIFLVCTGPVAMSLGWEFGVFATMLSVGSLVGARTAQEFARELRLLAMHAEVDPSEDLFKN